jgi:hypothetical protein
MLRAVSSRLKRCDDVQRRSARSNIGLEGAVGRGEEGLLEGFVTEYVGESTEL